MKNAGRLSLKAFSEQLETQVNSLSVDQLRNVIRRMSRDITPEGRASFLEQLGSVAADSFRPESIAKAESLLQDATAFKNRLAKAMKNPGERAHIQSSWRDDDESNEAYTDFGPELERLFDRTRTVFELARFDVACSTYEQLFEALSLQDDYGFGVHRPEGLDVREERGRYLRSVIEATSERQRAKSLLQTAHKLRKELWDASDISPIEAIEITARELPGKEQMFDEMLNLLRKDNEREADSWLREITRLRHGTPGLEKLARSDGERRPHAWVDWLEAVAAEGDPKKLVSASKDALAGIPDGLSLRATAADHLANAALALKDKGIAILGRWEAFRSDPCPRRLLDLWELTDSRAERERWMKRAETYSEQGGEPELPGPFVGGTGREDDAPFLESGEGFNDAASNATTMCARLLVGDWEGTLDKAKDEPPLGWSSGDNVQALVIPVLMSWFAGWPGAELGPNLAELLNQTLLRADEWEEKEPRTSARLRAALAEEIRLWRAPSDESKPVKTVVKICLKRVNAIVEAQHRGAYDRAALLAAAVGEMHRSRGEAAEAEAVFTGLLTRHNRKSAFKKELNARRAAGVKP
jgi:hypothetical protein